MAMIVGKRFSFPFEDIDPFTKRPKLDVAMGSAEEPCEPELDVAAQLQGCGFVEPAQKRLRLEELPCSSSGSPQASYAEAKREAAVREWAQSAVQQLQGCPSVQEALGVCTRVLKDFAGSVRQEVLQEVEATLAPHTQEEDARPQQDAQQRLQSTNRVLMRAVHHLAERCRRLEGSTEEAQALREALEESREQTRRLAHSAALLQSHLRLTLDGGHGGLHDAPHVLR